MKKIVLMMLTTLSVVFAGVEPKPFGPSYIIDVPFGIDSSTQKYCWKGQVWVYTRGGHGKSFVQQMINIGEGDNRRAIVASCKDK